jgi:hypothetical protein
MSVDDDLDDEGGTVTTDMSSLTKQMRSAITPLGAEEERRAVDAALASRNGTRESLLVRGAELVIEKPSRRGETPLRRVRVLVSVRAESVVHEVLVDEQGTVVSDRDLGPRNSPYLGDEIYQARAVAERDEQVARRLAGLKVGVGTFAPMLGASRHRLVGLHFLDVSDPDIPKPLTSVVVDLATGQLVHDIGHGH